MHLHSRCFTAIQINTLTHGDTLPNDIADHSCGASRCNRPIEQKPGIDKFSIEKYHEFFTSNFESSRIKMSRIWLIDGKAFNSTKWRSFVRESLKDTRVFLNDLNATLNDDGTVSIFGFTKTEGGEFEPVDEEMRSTFEHHPLYETNRGALAGSTLTPDHFDLEVIATFKLPEAERYERFDRLYSEAVQGHGGSLCECWGMIPDSAKLVFTLHLWERLQKRKLYPEVWAAALHLSWPHGKVGSMMFRANLGEKEVIQMFLHAPPHVLMAPDDLSIFNTLPDEITAWRGVSSISKFRERGFSWTLDRDRAEWFARANTAQGTPIIFEGTFKRTSVLMCSTFEEEIVINPLIPGSKITRIPLEISENFEKLSMLRDVLRERYAIKNPNMDTKMAA